MKIKFLKYSTVWRQLDLWAVLTRHSKPFAADCRGVYFARAIRGEWAQLLQLPADLLQGLGMMWYGEVCFSWYGCRSTLLFRPEIRLKFELMRQIIRVPT